MNIPTIPPIDQTSAAAAAARQNRLTKPAGSLGRLEALSIQLAGIQARPLPSVARKAVIVLAGDHGVCAEGVSAFPAAVTPQMVLNFLNGGAAINVLARQAGARVNVVDVGVNYDFEALPGLLRHKVAHGTHNMAQGAAMTRSEAEQSIQAGMDAVGVEIANGLDVVATGDMGIGNTTPSAAICAVLTGLVVAEVTGRGTGIDDVGLARKIAIIEKAIAINQPNPKDALDVLGKVGGLEIGAIAGVILGAAAQRVPVVIDGFISTAGAMIAAGLAPEVKPYLIGAHRSVEIGHRAMLESLGLKPLLDLDLRLGEGSGAVLAFHLLEAACRTLQEMATFADAGVNEK